MSVTRVGPRRGQQPSDSNQWLPPWVSSKLIPNTWGWVLSRTTCPFGAVPFLESVEGFRERQEGNVGSRRGRINSGHICLARNPTQIFLVPGPAACLDSHPALAQWERADVSELQAECLEWGICSIPLSPCALQTHTAPLNPKVLISGSKRDYLDAGTHISASLYLQGG